MSQFQGMLHHSAPERSLSLPFSGLWFLCLDLRNVSRTRSGASGDVSASLCRLDVAGMSPGCRRDVAVRQRSCGISRKKNSRHAIFFPFFRQNSIFYGVTNNVGAMRRVRYL